MNTFKAAIITLVMLTSAWSGSTLASWGHIANNSQSVKFDWGRIANTGKAASIDWGHIAKNSVDWGHIASNDIRPTDTNLRSKIILNRSNLAN